MITALQLVGHALWAAVLHAEWREGNCAFGGVIDARPHELGQRTLPTALRIALTPQVAKDMTAAVHALPLDRQCFVDRCAQFIAPQLHRIKMLLHVCPLRRFVAVH